MMKWIMCILFFITFFAPVTFADECYSNTSSMNLSIPSAFVYQRVKDVLLMALVPDENDSMVSYKCRSSKKLHFVDCGCKFVYRNGALLNCSSVSSKRKVGLVTWNKDRKSFKWWFYATSRGKRYFSLYKVNPAVCVAYIGI